MMRLSDLLALVLIVNSFWACDSDKMQKIDGVWIVADARADFDERKVNPQTFNQVLAYIRETQLEFRPDSTLIIQRGGVRTETTWHHDAATGILVMSAEGIGFSALSRRDGWLHTTELTPLGKVVIVFEKLPL
jgi:hypothetical protein